MNLRKLLYIILISVFLSGCVNADPSATNMVVNEPTPTSSPTIITTATPVEPEVPENETPIPRYPERIISDAECGDETVQGHILFVSPLMHSDRIAEALYIMDGNGCNPKLVMKHIFGSPAWSIDGNRIAIGCENGTSICILNANSILESCYRSEESSCKPEILKKYTVPGSSNHGDFNHISWSHTGDKLLVEMTNYEAKGGTFLLDLEEGSWRILLDGLWGETEFSPVNDYFIMSEGYAIRGMSLDEVLIKYYAYGRNAVYSPDGKRITFLFRSSREDEEPYGIMEWDEETLPLIETLYQTVKYDESWDRDNIIYLEPSQDRILSWSPYDRYLVFIEGRWKSRIMRLDNETGEVVNLTNNMGFDKYSYYSSLIWGP